MSISVDPGSFRDPSGFIFYRDNKIYRQVDRRYSVQYDHLMASGLYQTLVEDSLLISHSEVPVEVTASKDAYRILRPERIPFISYPFEWCFSQLRDAALITLRIQKEALKCGMCLKDASAYNIQYLSGKPILIDTLSFERYDEGRPWSAYQQFCRHFLAPLALMSLVDVRLAYLMRANIDGIPLDLASRLLPRSSWLKPGLLTHIHLHAAAQARYQSPESGKGREPGNVSRTALLGLIDNLETTIQSLKWTPAGTEWADYYNDTNYSARAMDGKQQLVADMIDEVSQDLHIVWDLGANTGRFSRLARDREAYTIAWDMDPAAVEKNYLECKRVGETRILPLVEDLTNPSPDLGWALSERSSLIKRGPVDLVMALALVHHLAIGNNVPLGRVATFMAEIGKCLIIEFVPKGDSQVKRLLTSKPDVFDSYTQEDFEKEFSRYFTTLRTAPVPESDRTLYLMRAHTQ